MQELTIFDLGVTEVVKEKKVVDTKEKKEKGKSSPQNNKSAAGKKPEPKPEPKPEVKVTGEWTIHFATEQFQATDFVEEIPEEGITLEDLRVELEKHFAQFSAARTKWDVDEENKRLFPDAFAGSKGGHSQLRGPFFTSLDEAENHPGSVAYVPGQDGLLYEVRKSPFGRMIAETSFVPHLDEINSGFKFDLPKIPSSILANIISFFKAYTMKGSYEVMIRVYWDLEMEQYVVECPEQVVTGVRIDCRYDSQFTGRNQQRYMVVLEIHSHNTMPAFFSATDDQDEQRFGLYAVVGRLNQDAPEMIVRAKSNDHSVIVVAADVFDLDFKNVAEGYPSDWDKQVTLRGGYDENRR